MDLKKELENFWAWSKISPIEYSETPDYGAWEIDYEGWDKIYNAASEAIDLLNCNEIHYNYLLDNLLSAIAIDKEEHRIIDECEKRLHNLHYLYKNAISHIQPYARSEIARILGSKTMDEAENYLLLLCDDKTDFVSLNALDSLSQVNPGKAEKLAIELLSDYRDYVRIYAFQVLQKLNSPLLPKARALLEKDEWSSKQ